MLPRMTSGDIWTCGFRGSTFRITLEFSRLIHVLAVTSGQADQLVVTTSITLCIDMLGTQMTPFDGVKGLVQKH